MQHKPVLPQRAVRVVSEDVVWDDDSVVLTLLLLVQFPSLTRGKWGWGKAGNRHSVYGKERKADLNTPR